MQTIFRFVIDGVDPNTIKDIFENEIALEEEHLMSGSKIWEAAGGYSPTIGIIGAVMGLIQVMKDLEDIKAVGHGIAVAFVATVYGVASANLFFLPVANKLRDRIRAAALAKDLILEGVVGLLEGLNPTLLRMKLDSYNQDSPKPAKVKGAKAAGQPALAGQPARGES